MCSQSALAGLQHDGTVPPLRPSQCRWRHSKPCRPRLRESLSGRIRVLWQTTSPIDGGGGGVPRTALRASRVARPPLPSTPCRSDRTPDLLPSQSTDRPAPVGGTVRPYIAAGDHRQVGGRQVQPAVHVTTRACRRRTCSRPASGVDGCPGRIPSLPGRHSMALAMAGGFC